MQNLPPYHVEIAPVAGGFMASIFRVEVENERITSREFWRTLDLPRPTRNLARKDAEDLATTELYREASGNDRSSTGETSPPNVTAEQIMERAHADGFTGIGDGLRTYLGDVPLPYALGFERAIAGLLPPKEIALPLYLKGYEDGQTAYPILLDAGAMGTGAVAASYRDPRHWRDLPNFPRNEGVILSESDQFADYTIERMALDIQPVFEPGYPPAEGEIRELRIKHYLQATATLHERPLPKDWFDFLRKPMRLPPDDQDRLAKLVMPVRHGHYAVPGEGGLRNALAEDGRLTLTIEVGRSGDDERAEDTDPSTALMKMKHIVGSTVAMLEERRRQDPNSFVRDPVTAYFQQEAAELRWRREQGPIQTPEISDEREAELQAQGQSAQASVRAWNEGSRRNFEKAMARLADLEEWLRLRGADPYDTGGWTPRHERGDRHWPHDGEPYFGWEPYSAPGISDEQLLYEITRTVERVRPGEFDIQLGKRGVIEIRPRDPEVVIVEHKYHHISEPIPRRYEELRRALWRAGDRWHVSLWDVPNRHEETARGRWVARGAGRWHVALRRAILGAEVTPPSSTKLREEHVYLEVQLAPPDSRAPAEWEC